MPGADLSRGYLVLASLLLGACGRDGLFPDSPALPSTAPPPTAPPSTVPDCSGVDLQTDVNNCGACGNRCSVIAPSTASCTGGRCLVTLASDQDYTAWIAVDAETVYWTGGDAVKGISKMGGQPVTVVGDQRDGPSSITLDDTNLYWINGDVHAAIMQAPKHGGAAIPLAEDQPGADAGIAVDATSVYWTTNPTLDYPSGSIMKVAIGGGTPIALATKQYAPIGVGLAATNTYWTTGDDSLMTVPTAGGTPVQIGRAASGHLVVTNGVVYSFSGEDVVKTPAGGGETTTLAGSPGHTFPIGIAVDDASVYWTEDDSILKVPTSGGPSTRLLRDQQQPWGIAVDDTSVYWTDQLAKTVMKLTPK